MGEFTDSALQALYDKLIAQGSTSVAAALKVGAAIEEIDILDLQERVAVTTHADIVRVYGNLLAGFRKPPARLLVQPGAPDRHGLCAPVHG